MQPMTLGELIDTLKPLADRWPDAWVNFDFCELKPCGLHSYRGAHKDLAIGFDEDKSIKVSDFLNDLQGAVGATYQGYKGGEFTMSRSTLVWVANPGNYHNTGIVRIASYVQEETEERRAWGMITLITAKCD